MDDPIAVRIFGVPLTCATGVTDAWGEVANWARKQLTARFGEQVSVEYYDLFSPQMDRFPEVLALVRGGDTAMPLVFVGTDLVSAGGKISLPTIRRRLEAAGLKPQL
jgi:disulfide oxidoreductase YuzD